MNECGVGVSDRGDMTARELVRKGKRFNSVERGEERFVRWKFSVMGRGVVMVASLVSVDTGFSRRYVLCPRCY